MLKLLYFTYSHNLVKRHHPGSILLFLTNIRLLIILLNSSLISRQLNLYIRQGTRDYSSTGVIVKINTLS